jgi:hypothetical protein
MSATNTAVTAESSITVNDLVNSQRVRLLEVDEMCVINGGSSQLSPAPASLIKHNLVVKCGRHASGNHGWPARYKLTDAGKEIVRQLKAAQESMV